MTGSGLSTLVKIWQLTWFERGQVSRHENLLTTKPQSGPKIVAEIVRGLLYNHAHKTLEVRANAS